MAALERSLLMATALFTGVMAGFFFSFSVVVMPGLDRAAPLAALDAMQSINVVVRNPLFGLFFFGAPLLCLLTIAAAARRPRELGAWLAAAGAVIYLVGVFGVTVAFNVPLNDELAELDSALPSNAAAMREYITDWSRWNHVRTLAGSIGFALLTVAPLLRVVELRITRRAVDGAPA